MTLRPSLQLTLFGEDDNMAEDATMNEQIARLAAAAEALASASQAGAGAGTANARTASNDERADHMDVAHERGRTTDWVSGGVEHGSDINVNEAMQEGMIESRGRNRSWFDVGMERLNRHIEDKHASAERMQRLYEMELAKESEHHRTMRSKNYTNLFTTVDEMEVNTLSAAILSLVAQLKASQGGG